MYTNVPAEQWDLDFEINPYERPSGTDHLNLSAQCLKDLWQFRMPEHHDGVWCVDWDFLLVDKSKLPEGDMVIATEWVKSPKEVDGQRLKGGQIPKEVIRKGVRCHLGISKFPFKSSIAKRIADGIEAHLPKMDGVTKTHKQSLWLENVRIAQRILLEEGYVFPDPVVLNPWPFWMKGPKFGQVVYNTPMPSVEEAKERTAAVTLWAGYPCFPKDEVLGIFSRLQGGGS